MDFSESKKTRALICLALAIVTVGVYWRVTGFDFVNYDDPDYVTGNHFVTSGLTPAGVVWAFTHFHAGNWHPLTWISHMMDCELFGLHPGAHHFVNVLLHAANAVLLFLLLERMTRAQWRSAIVAGLFALHPLHVESVAWISERKDVLSAFFGLLSLIAYVKYGSESSRLRAASARQAVQSSKSKVWYPSALICFALSLMAKPMLVTLPFVMLLLDVWPLQRVENSGWRTFVSPQFGKLVWEKSLWFVLAAASCVITFFAQKAGGAIANSEYFPFAGRLMNAITAYFDYVLKACWPVHLAVFYPLQHRQPLGLLLIAVVSLAVISIAAMMTNKRQPYFFVGWFWFLGTLVPAIGLVQVGGQAMADRYTYVPLIGLFIAIVWGAGELLRRVKMASIFGMVTAVMAMILFACATISQLQYWQNSLTLFNHALAVTRENALANNDLGTALASAGQREEALAHYKEAVRIDPNNAHYQNNLATALARAGQRDSAMEHYAAAIRADPQFAEAHSNLGALLLAEHRVADAITNLEVAIQIEPEHAEARSNLGNALSAAGRVDEALAQYSEALRLKPDDATIHLNAGLALVKAGRTKDAVVQFTEAVRLNPASAEGHYELGRQLFLAAHYQSASEQLGAAIRLRPNYAAAEFYQASAFGEMGRFDEAVLTGNQALESAQQTRQTNLIARIQEALELFKSHRSLRQKGGGVN